MQETHVTGRTLRDQSKHSLNYMLVTLGIEKDDDSDEDFVLDYMEEDNEEEEDLPFSVSDAEITQKAGKTFGFVICHVHLVNVQLVFYLYHV
ncbi:hypothetical protein PInf_006315 [Phytophthora infestans]|nr:hypothetical protein PInf_006315 [Phytophthora infestans]